MRKIGDDVQKRLEKDGVFNVSASLEYCSSAATKKMVEMKNIDASSLGTLSALVDQEKAMQMVDQFRDREMEGRFKMYCSQNRRARVPLEVLFAKKQEKVEWLRRCLERGVDISDKAPLSLQSNTVNPHWPQWPSTISKDEFENVVRALEQSGWIKIITGAPACELLARVEYIVPADMWQPVEALRTVLGGTNCFVLLMGWIDRVAVFCAIFCRSVLNAEWRAGLDKSGAIVDAAQRPCEKN